MKGLENKVPECWICLGDGLVCYDRREFGCEYEVAASCKCREGLEYNAVPEVSDTMAEWIAETNFKEWEKNNPELAEELVKEMEK